MNMRAYLRPMNKSEVVLPLLVLAGLFLANLYIFWPGQMFPDSIMQYKAAVTGVYKDDNPPMMSVVWALFDYVYKGPGLMLLFHLLLLYGTMATLIMIFQKNWLRWVYALLPLVPPISLYSTMIWKDNSFTFSYLLAMALMSYFIVQQKRPPLIMATVIALLLFYGTGAKFQAQYVLPVMLFGFCYLYNNFTINARLCLKTLGLFGVFLCALMLFNDYYVPRSKKSHWWQLVKLYDLAAISLDSGSNVFPEFIKQHPLFSMQKVNDNFNYERVDDLVWVGQNPPLRMAIDEQERALIMQAWLSAVRQHPVSYLKHRFALWWTMVNNYPIKNLATLDFGRYAGMRWFTQLQKAAGDSGDSSARHYAGMLLLWLLSVIRFVLRFSFLLPFIFAYVVFGLCSWSRNKNYALPLLLFNVAGLFLLLALFFFSMASTIRYVYFTICMFHASHGFAYMCLKSWLGKKS